jgi:glutaminyl-peptide cyclotransferase
MANLKFFRKKFLNRLLFVIIVMLSVGFSCRQTSNQVQRTLNESTPEVSAKKKVYFASPKNNQTFKLGDHITLLTGFSDSLKRPDSIMFFIDNKPLASVKRGTEQVIWNTSEASVGIRNIGYIAYFPSKSEEQDYIQITLMPKNPPVNYTFQVMNTYPHDAQAYTQGLIYDNTFLYEGTGLYGQSSLRKVKLTTGDVLQRYNLPNEIFGEGITIYDNKIIQISWKEQTAFLFDKTSFNLLNKFNYPIKEGWGITFDGKNLIMSDGSEKLYFLDKEYFTEVKHIEVYDNHGPVTRLNELEYIEGEVWANVYTTDTIVRINPKTGAITGKIIMTNLLKARDRSQNTEVLNGIAYDPQTKRIFVTGKNWPKLFEITIHEKKR